MNIPSSLKYTESDEWFNPEDGKIGISDYAQDQLSDIVFVEILVEVGETVDIKTPIASIESVKAASEVYSPVAGKVVAINESLDDAPETLNSDPYGAGWLIQVEPSAETDMMDSAAYEAYCASRE